MRLWIMLVVLGGFFCLIGCESKAKQAPQAQESYGQVADFSLAERGGRTVKLGDLHGKVWIASFIFTRCAGPCSQVSASMASLQKELAGEQGIVLVSFTVDPEHDTPKVLQEYGKRFSADPERWLFLTGKQDVVYPLIQKSFHLAVEPTTGAERRPGNEVTHSTRLALVDRKGEIRGYFDGTNPDDVKGLPAKVRVLISEKP